MSTIDFQEEALGKSRNKYLWFILLLLGGGILFAGYFSPSTLKIQNKVPQECPKGIYTTLGYDCESFNTFPIFTMEIDTINSANQFIVLQAIPTLEKNSKVENLTIEIEASAFVVGQNHNILKVISRKLNKIVSFECEGEGDYQKCEPNSLMEITEIDDSHYLFVVKIFNGKQLEDEKVTDIVLAFVSFNPNFQQYFNYLKWVLFIFAIMNFIIYQVKLWKLPSYRSDEQIHVRLMALMLIFFNEPFIQYSTITGHFIYTTISVIIVSAQSALLTLFWFSLLERLASLNNKAPDAIKLYVKVLAFIHFLMSSFAYTTLASDQLQNPFVDLQHDINPFTTMCRYYLYLFVFSAMIWSFTKMVQIIPKFKELSWRDEVSFVFTFCYVVCYLFFIATGSLQAMNLKGARVIALFGVTTMYTVILSIIHYPFAQEIINAEKKRKYENPIPNVQYSDINLDDMSISDSKGKGNLKKGDELKVDKTFDEDEVAI